MSGNQEEVDVKIGVKTEGLTDELAQATGHIKTACTELEGHFSGLSRAMDNLRAPFLALGGVLMGTAMFKDMIKETSKWTDEAVALSRAMGITTQEASILNLAIGDLFIPTEVLLKATSVLTRQVANESDAFARLGLRTRDANGALKPTQQILGEVVEKLNGMKKGTDMNAAGALLFGRQWSEVRKILLLNKDALEEARRKAEQLDLVVGGDAVAATRRYKLALNDVEDVVTALKVKIGRELLPVLTALGEKMSDEGPKAVSGLSYVIKGLVTAFYALDAVIKTVSISVATNFATVFSGVGSFGRLMGEVMRGDFKGAMLTAKAEAANFKNEWNATLEGIGEAWRKMSANTKALWNPEEFVGPPSTDDSSAKDGLAPKGDSGKAMQGFKAELEAKKAEEENWFTWSVSRELEFWQKKLAISRGNKELFEAVQAEWNQVRKAKQQEDHEAEIEALKMQMDAVRLNGVQRLAVQQEITRKEAQVHGEGSREVLASLREEQRVRKEIADENNRILMIVVSREAAHQQALIAQAQAASQHQVNMGRMSAQEQLEIERQLADQRLQIQLGVLKEEEDLAKGNEEELARIYARRVALLDEYAGEVQGVTNRLAEAQRSASLSFWEPFRSAFEQAMEGIMNGSLSWSEGFKKLMQGLGRAFDQMVIQMVSKWALGESLKTQATAGSVLARVTLEAWGVIKKVALWIWEGMRYIAIQAWQAAAGAFKAIVGIPYVGPILAPLAAAGALAAVISLGSKLSSAKGGWGQVPSDQLAMVHKNEMILPDREAGTMRALGQWMESGGVPGGGGGDTHIHINAVDAKSVATLFRDQGSALVEALRGQTRNFAFAGSR